MYKGGSGSGSNNAESVNLKTALESVGFSVNESLWNFIVKEKNSSASAENSTVGNTIAGQYEVDTAKYDEAVSFTSAKSYSDYAIVTFGTSGGEGADGDRTDDSNSLELGANEIKLLEKLDSQGFKVIALINSSYVMELGPVIEHADAILWVGGTGLYGTYGIANIIAGKANPSGRLVDTWMYEQETSSTYYTTINDSAYYKDESGNTIAAYTNYNEGIYVGYKWYETADAEGYWQGVSNKYGTGYQGVVAYPFGYGLSYTTFSEQITSAELKGDTFTITVDVKNTGTVAGKDVVELYVEKPYTNGGVEVSKVELVDFAKTNTLSSSDTQTLTLSVDREYLASYDTSANGGKGAYVLAEGDYKFYIGTGRTGAHCWAYDENPTKFSLERVEYSGSNKRSSDGVVATNKLQTTANDTGISCNDGTAGFNELSRKDGFANASSTISKEANKNGDVILSSESALYKALKSTYGSNTYKTYNTDHLAEIKANNSDITNALTGQKKVYSLSDLYTTDKDGNPLYTIDSETGERVVTGSVDYDDPRWDVLISQMTVAEMEELIGRGGYGTIAVDSIDKIAGRDYDGPLGYSNFLKASLNIEQETTGFCSEPIMAATRNLDLIESYGEAVGMEGNAFGNTGWYAPGMNMHRTPFEGRTAEYFSEDSYLTGMMGAYVAYGAFNKGVYTYAKHFAFNEIEANRESGMNCWMSEQTAREIYLRPFEIAIKQGKLTGMMTSFMYFNAQWNGADYNLVSGIVRSEWNFKGVMNTDLAGPATMGAEKAIIAGTDMLLSTKYGQNASLAWMRCDTLKTSDDGIIAMKVAVKHILYSYASSALNRDVVAEEADTSNVTGLYIGLNIVGYGGAVILLALFVFLLLRDIRSHSVKVETIAEDPNSTTN
jgi:beta-glucosidase